MAKPRSKSIVRARKRARGDLASQHDSSQDDESTRSWKIAEAMGRASSRAVANWPDCDAWRPKSMFDLYYKLQKVVERWEWCGDPHINACARVGTP